METQNKKSSKMCNNCNINELISSNYTGEIFNTLFDYLKSTSKKLGVEQCFYTYDLADVLWKVKLWEEHLPRVRPYYAVKTNSDPTLLRFLQLLGFSFDCASEAEIKMIMETWYDPKKIVFAHVVKNPNALKYAKNIGVDLLTFDSEDELLKIKQVYPTARLLLRLVPEEVKCTFDLSDKYGCFLSETLSLLTRAKDMNLNVVGVCFHVGGLCTNSITYSATIRASRQVFDAAQKLGFNFSILDIGGGFVGEKGSENLFIETAQVIKSALKEYFTNVNVDIIAEPGTFFIGSAVTLTTAICGKKKRNTDRNVFGSNKNIIERYYYINDGVYGSFFRGWEEYGYKISPLLEETELNQRTIHASRLFGQTCCSEDVVLQDVSLPEMEEGEYLAWRNMGAYSLGICSTFCGAPLPAKRHVFIHSDKLNLEWSKYPEAMNFIKKTCSLIKEDCLS